MVPILLKETIKSRLLYSRGIVKRAYQVAENCLQQAKQVQNFDIVISILQQQASMICIHQDETSYFEKVAEIDYYESCRNISTKAERLYRELSMKKYHSILENLDLFIDVSLKQLYAFQVKVRLISLDFIVLSFEKEKHELEGNIFDSLQTTIKLYEKCLASGACSLVFNVYELVYEQARLSYELGRAEETIFLLDRCIKKLPMENVACQKSFELLFLIQFLDKKTAAAKGTLQKLKESDFYGKLMPAPLKSRWVYYEACLFFSLSEPKKCIRVLATADISGLDDLDKIRLRFLKIMAFVELEYLDMADKQIESTRKFIERNGLADIMQESGLHLFFECLTALKYCGYDFQSLPAKLPGLQGNLNMLKARKLLNTRLNSWLVEYGVWIRQKLEPEEIHNDFIHWQVCRREHYYDTGKIKRIYI